MSFEFIGMTNKIKLVHDPDFQLPTCHEWKINYEYMLTSISINKNGKNYKFDLIWDYAFYKFLTISSNKWLLVTDTNKFYIGIEKKIEVIRLGPNIHITEKGIYYIMGSKVYFLNLQSGEIDVFKIIKNAEVYWYRGFMIQEDKCKLHIYIHLENLPQFIDVDIIRKVSHMKVIDTTHPKNQITIHFKNAVKEFSLQEVTEFESDFINLQIESSEIYLEINLEDFNLENFETLKYLNCNKIKDLYYSHLIKNILTQNDLYSYRYR